MAPEIGISNTIPFQMNVRAISGSSAFEYTAIDNSFSMEFNGTSSYYYGPPLGDLIDLDPTTSTFTISCWVYAPSIGYRGICASANFSNGLQLYTNGSNLYFGIAGGSSQINAGITYAGGWHHVAASFNGPEFGGTTLRLYFDGVEIATGTGNRTGNLFANYNLDIGARNDAAGTASTFWLGNLDEFAVFSTALSEETIKAIYDATANNPGKVADLSETPEGAPAAWYRMGD